MKDKDLSEFEKIAVKESGGSFISELWHSMRQNKKWWMAPIIIAVLLFGLLMVLGSSALAPFIYTIF